MVRIIVFSTHRVNNYTAASHALTASNDYTELFSYKDNRFVLAKQVHVTGTSAIVLYYLLGSYRIWGKPQRRG
jgi:hypothetical protein